jgi:spore coat polysaccharide biosynthesis protein SpsF (cytidylyltransferase family)/spore coat polysaccharide biosynthesis predicted glycosyltransferase SpsG
MISAIILLRSNSSRLPLKHLYTIGHQKIINIIIEKLNNISLIKEIILATGTVKNNLIYRKNIKINKKIKFHYHKNNWNVTERINNVLKKSKHEFALVISGDCIVIDKEFINYKVRILKKNPDKNFLHFSNQNVGYEGINLFRKLAWKKVFNMSNKKKYLEHPGLIVKEKRNLFKIKTIRAPKLFCLKKKIRLSIDTYSDLEFFRILLSKLKKYKNINLKNIKKFNIYSKINNHVIQRKVNRKYNKKITFVSHASRKYGLGHLRRTQTLIRDFSETFTSNIELIILGKINFTLINKIIYFRNCKISFNNNNIKNKFLIIDLPKDILKSNLNLIKKNRKIVLIDNNEFQSEKIINIMPSFLKVKKKFTKTKIFSGKKFLIINREINYYNMLNFSQINQTLILSGGSLFPPQEIFNIVKNNERHKFVLVLGPFSKKAPKAFKAYRNLKILFNPDNYFELIKQSKHIICRYGVSVYEVLALKKKPFVWTSEEEESRIKEIKILNKKNLFHLTENYPYKKSVNRIEIIEPGAIEVVKKINLFFENRKKYHC